MAIQTKSLGLVALFALSTLALAAQAGPIVRKVKAGDEQKFRVKANIELGGNEIVFSGLQTEKILEVAPDGSYTVESKTTNAKVTFGGQDVDIPADQTPATTSVYNPDGTIKEIRGDNAQAESYRFANLGAIFFTGKEEGKIGTTWTNDKVADTKSGAVGYKSTYKVVGEEKVGNYDTWKIEFSTKESEGDAPASSDGTVWLDKADGSMVKNEAKWSNAPFPGAPGPVNGTVSITRE